MPENTIDPRIVRTKKLLKDALSELIEEKGIESITVKDLTMRAGLNRGTFYLNYVDKFDLLHKCEEDALRGLSEIAKSVNPLTVFHYFSKNEPFPPFVNIFQYLAENSAFFKAILGPKGDPGFQIRFKKYMENTFYEKLVQNGLKDNINSVPVDYLLSYITSANLGLILHWFDNDMNYTPQALAKIMVQFSYGGPLRLILSNQSETNKDDLSPN